MKKILLHILICFAGVLDGSAALPPLVRLYNYSSSEELILYPDTNSGQGYYENQQYGFHYWMCISSGDNTSGTSGVSISKGNADFSYSATGYYNYETGEFSSEVAIDNFTVSSVDSQGNPWTPPPPPLTVAQFGPPSVWVNGSVYVWCSSDLLAGVDTYRMNGSYELTLTNGNGDECAIALTTPSGQTVAGVYSKDKRMFRMEAQFQAADVRYADEYGSWVSIAPPNSSLPWAITVDGGGDVWKYLGETPSYSGGSLYHFGGENGGQRLTVQADGLLCAVSASPTWSCSGVLRDGFILSAVDADNVSHDIRALMAPTSTHQYGPAKVEVNGAVWEYAGSWTGWNATTPISSFDPIVGDYYQGANTRQQIVVDSFGNITLWNTDHSGTGIYSSADWLFTALTVSDELWALDDSGNRLASEPSPQGAPPPLSCPIAIWVNGMLFTDPAYNSGGEANYFAVYSDGTGATVAIQQSYESATSTWSFTSAVGYDTQSEPVWSGNYFPSSASGVNGIFVVSQALFDVRPSTGSSPLIPGYPSSGRPAKLKVNGEEWVFAGRLDGASQGGQIQQGIDYYFGSEAGERLLVLENGDVGVWHSAVVTAENSGFLDGKVFLVGEHDVRALMDSGAPDLPLSGTPTWGPANVWVDGVVWRWLGTIDNPTREVYADYYGGPNSRQVLTISGSSVLLSESTGQTYSGTYQNGVFLTEGVDVRSLGTDSRPAAPITSPENGSGSNLRVGGLHWIYLGSVNSVDHYASGVGGQRLTLDTAGYVIYSDLPHNVANATGTYTNSTYTSISGGTSYNAGTIVGDLDILGNALSFGSLKDNRSLAGATFSFNDDISSNHAISTVSHAAARPMSQWLWSHGVLGAEGALSGDTLPMMQLDFANRLSIYEPAEGASSSTPVGILLDPSGTSNIAGSLAVGGALMLAGEPVLTQVQSDSRYVKSAEGGLPVALATGLNVHAGGTGASSSNNAAQSSVTLGTGLTASQGQLVFGQFNTSDNVGNLLFMIGAGSNDENRKNAFSISTGGDTTVNGNLMVTSSLTSTGDSTVNGKLGVGDSATFSSSVNVLGNTTVQGVLRVVPRGNISMGIFVNGTQP